MTLMRIEFDQKKADEALRFLQGAPKKARVALVRALNASAMSARTEIVRSARERFNVQSSRVRSTIHVFKASAATDAPSAQVSSKDTRQPLTRFKFSPKGPKSWIGVPNTRRGPVVSVSVKHGRSTKFRHSFLARFRSGHLGLVYRARGKFTRNGRPKLEENYGPAVPQMIGGPSGAEAVADAAVKKFDAELERQVDLMLKG
ncbi:MAG: phage tail protein [Pyramidobacter sp.]|nr:phage tail protein [Pyramidobacter sp.]MBQ9423744.1 phage tail protein [Pyramidobacter sp.]MBR0108049.1 phage tail protein [Pyramidobacter sp.]